MECAFCGEALAEPDAALREAKVECACGFVNLVEHDEMPMPLRETIEQVAPGRNDLLADSDDPQRCREVLGQLFDLVLARAHRIVEADLDAACLAVGRYLAHFEEESLAYRRGDANRALSVPSVGRAVQLLVSSIFLIGRSPSELAAADWRVRQFVAKHSEIASNVFSLSGFIDQLRNGMIEGRFRGGVFYLRKTALHISMKEWAHNRDLRWKRSTITRERDELFSAPSHEAQEVLLGFSPDLAAQLFENRHERLKKMASAQEGSLYFIDERDCDEGVLRLFQAFLFTEERLRAFSQPFYWDLGTRDETVDGTEILSRAGRQNWLNYYPVIPTVGIDGARGFLVSAEILTYAVGNLEMYKGRLLERVYGETRSNGVSEASLNRIARLRGQAHRDFEKFAARAAQNAGFEATTSVHECDGRMLEGGEIDLLIAATGDDGRLIVGLAEVKDFDITFQRSHTLELLRNKIADAERQLARKLADVKRQWPNLLEERWPGRFAAAAQPAIVAIVVTSQFLPAMVYGDYPLISVEALPEFLRMLRTGLRRFPKNFAAAGLA